MSNFFYKVGSLFGLNKKINYNFGQSTFKIFDKGEVWIDCDNTREIYDTIPQASIVIDRDADLFANADIFLVDKKGEKIEGKIQDDFIKLISNPNVVEGSMNDFLKNHKKQLNIYGNSYMYKNQPISSMLPVALWNISPANLKMNVTGKMFDQTSLSGIIKGYEYKNKLGYNKTLTVDDVCHFKISDVDNLIEGKSKLSGLKFPLSNTDAAYKYLNTISTKKGNIGILSGASSDSQGKLPITPEVKKAIFGDFIKNNGIEEDQMAINVTEQDVKWTPMSYPTGQLLLLEQIDANFLTIIDKFGHNSNIYSNKNSTFENVKNGLIQTYQDAIFPYADNFGQLMTKFLGYTGDVKVNLSYSHLEILKEAKKDSYTSIETITKILTESLSAGLITKDQATIILANELNIR